jgi:serine/threonine-protein kinase
MGCAACKAVFAMTSAMVAGTLVGGFCVQRTVGTGATGSVYLAEDIAGERVALKILASELADDERFRRRFLRESELARSLDHPHIVSTLAEGDDDGLLYMAMRYVDGPNLRSVIQSEGLLEPRRALGLLGQVASALDAAHARGLVHRDVKPANILIESISDGEQAYVCDFGLARHRSSAGSLTGEGFVGTIDYIAPEQIEGDAVSGSADLYSLGCVLFESMTGERPFPRGTEVAVVFAHLNDRPPAASDVNPELPEAIDDVFAVALSKDPRQRFKTCRELIDAAEQALTGTAPRRRRWTRRLALAAATSAVVVAVVTSSVLGDIFGHSAAASITETSIAGARLGLTFPAYERLLGLGVPVDQPKGGRYGGTGTPTVTFDNRKVWVFFSDSNLDKATAIVTWNKELKTDRGIGPCSTVAQLKKAYGSSVHPDHFSTIGTTVFAYDVGKNLIFATPGPAGFPSTFVTAVGLFNGSAPHANRTGGARPFAGYETGYETPHCS